MFGSRCDCTGMNFTNTQTFDFEQGLQINRYMSWAFKELLVCMCRLRHHHVCMTIRITVTTFWVLKERVACNFLVCHFEVEQNTWRYTEVQVGEYAEYSGSYAGMLTTLLSVSGQCSVAARVRSCEPSNFQYTWDEQPNDHQLPKERTPPPPALPYCRMWST